MVLKRQLSYIFFSLLLLFSCQSEDVSDPNQERGFDKAKIEKMNSSDRYDYDREFETEEPKPDEESEKTEPNIFAKILAHIFSFLAFLFNNVLGYLLLGGLIVLLIYILARNSDKFFGLRREVSAESVHIIDEDNIEEVNYDKLLAMALKEGDYTLAIRYHFLKSLKHLQKLELIKWNKDKTNYEYLMEVPDRYQEPLNKLISIYEYVWYGHFQASEEMYNRLAGRAMELQSIKEK